MFKGTSPEGRIRSSLNQRSLTVRALGGTDRAFVAAARQVEIIGPPRERRHTSQVRDAVLVIDASPSMDETDWPPSRLAAAKEAAKAFVRRLGREESDARVAVVAYSEQACKIAGLTSASEWRVPHRAIDEITTSDWTNVTAGLRLAYRMLKNQAGVGQVVLLTDGEHNTGFNPYRIAGWIRRVATLNCVGIGGRPADVDETLLKRIASPYPDGSKRYRWIGDEERLVEHFHQLAGRITRQ